MKKSLGAWTGTERADLIRNLSVMIFTPSRLYKNCFKLTLKKKKILIFLTAIFNYRNTLAENSQSLLHFLTNYHLTAIHYLFASPYFICLLWGTILRYRQAFASSVALKCFFPLESFPNFMWSAQFIWRNKSPGASSNPSSLHHGTCMWFFWGVSTALSQTAIPPFWVRAYTRKRRVRTVLACSLANPYE